MNIVNSKIFQTYFDDIYNLIDYFTDSKERTQIVLKKLELHIENESAIVGAHIINNKLVSFIWCHERIFGGENRLHISYFIVNDFFRGQGLSKELLIFAEENAKKLNINLIDLNVEPDNDKAIKIYEKSGFTTERLQLVMKVNRGDEIV